MITIEGKEVFTELTELVDPAHTALLLVDMQRDFVESDGAFGELTMLQLPLLDQRLMGARVRLENRRSTCHPDGWRQSPAEADAEAAVWTPTDEEAASFGGSSMSTYEFECRDCQERIGTFTPFSLANRLASS